MRYLLYVLACEHLSCSVFSQILWPSRQNEFICLGGCSTFTCEDCWHANAWVNDWSHNFNWLNENHFEHCLTIPVPRVRISVHTQFNLGRNYKCTPYAPVFFSSPPPAPDAQCKGSGECNGIANSECVRFGRGRVCTCSLGFVRTVNRAGRQRCVKGQCEQKPYNGNLYRCS